MKDHKKTENNKDVLEEDSVDEILSWGSPISRATDSVSSQNNSPQSTTLDFLDDEISSEENGNSVIQKLKGLNLESKNDIEVKSSKKRSIFDSSESAEEKQHIQPPEASSSVSELLNSNSVKSISNEYNEEVQGIAINESIRTKENTNDKNNSENQEAGRSIWDDTDEPLFGVDNEEIIVPQATETNEIDALSKECDKTTEKKHIQDIVKKEENSGTKTDENTAIEKGCIEESLNTVENDEYNTYSDNTRGLCTNLEIEYEISNENTFEERTDIEYLQSTRSEEAKSFCSQEYSESISGLHLSETVEAIKADLDTTKNSNKVCIEQKDMVLPESLLSNEKNANDTITRPQSSFDQIASSSCDDGAINDDETNTLSNKELPGINEAEASNLEDNKNLDSNEKASAYNSSLFSSSEEDLFEINFKNKILDGAATNNKDKTSNECIIDKANDKDEANKQKYDVVEANRSEDEHIVDYKPDKQDTQAKSKHELRTKILHKEQTQQDKNIDMRIDDNMYTSNQTIDASTLTELNNIEFAKSNPICDTLKESIKSLSVNKVTRQNLQHEYVRTKPIAIHYIGNVLVMCTIKHTKRAVHGNIVDVQINSTAFYSPVFPELSEKSFKEKAVFEIINLPLKNIITDYPLIKSTLCLSDDTIFTKDVTFNLNSDFLNKCCNQGVSLMENTNEFINFVDNNVKANTLQYEIMKMKFGLPYVFENIKINVNLFYQIALTGDQSLIKAFITSQKSAILYFLIFYKLNLVRYEPYKYLFESNIYSHFILSKVGLTECVSKTKSTWNMSSIISQGISKILNVNKIEQSGVKYPLEIAFFEGHNRDDKHQELQKIDFGNVPKKQFNLNEPSKKYDARSLNKKEAVAPDFINKLHNSINLPTQDTVAMSSPQIIPIVPAKQKPTIPQIKSVEESKILQHENLNQKKLKSNNVFGESDDNDIFNTEELSKPIVGDNKDSKEEDTVKQQLPMFLPNNNLFVGECKALKFNTLSTPNLKSLGNRLKNSCQSLPSIDKYPYNPISEDLSEKKPATQPLPIISDALTSTIYKSDSNAKSTSDLDDAKLYKKKFSKSFADIFSLENGQNLVSETPDLSSCFAELNETDKPILEAKEPLGNRFMNFFRRKPAATASQAGSDPMLDRFTRPSKAELKMPENKERKVIQSTYANMKEAPTVDIPGFKSTKKQ